MKFQINKANKPITHSFLITLRKKSILVWMALTTFFLILYYLLPLPLFAQQSPLSITFAPNQADLKTGEEKLLKVSLSSDQAISAFDLTFQSSSGLTINDFDGRLGFDNSFNPFNLKQVAKEINNTGGRISYILNARTQDLPKRIDLYLKISGTTTGEGKITLDFNKSQALNGNNELLQISPNQTATFNLNRNQSSPEFTDPANLPGLNYPDSTARINLKLKLYGAENSPQNGLKGTVVAVGRVGESKFETQPQRLNLTRSEDGTFSGSVAFPNFRDGTRFSLMLKVDNYLLRRICTSNPTESNLGQYQCTNPSLTIRQGENNFDLSGVSLLPGDLGIIDGILNSYDLSIVRNNINKNTIEAVAVADLNYDSKVDAKDFEIINFVAGNTTREADQ